MLHFAYGSNMSVPMMRRMCPAARCEGRAILPGYRVFIMREGYASIRRAPATVGDFEKYAAGATLTSGIDLVTGLLRTA